MSKVRRRLSTAIQKESGKTQHRKPEVRVREETQSEELVLPSNTELFRGYGFVITGSDVKSSRDQEDSPTEDDHNNFNRKHVCRQIETGGGVILNTFHDDVTMNKSCLLLSSSCQTTAKYFHALVASIPCLSHAWVRDCCRDNKLLSYGSYLLPVGKDLISGEMIEQQKESDCLRGLKVSNARLLSILVPRTLLSLSLSH